MPCQHVSLPGGGSAIVCTSRRRQRCACGQPATLLCDWKVPTKRAGTCDAPICARCAARFDHPTTKLDALMSKIVTNAAGDSVCDPIMGTGSTGVAAIRAGKRFTGIEKDPAYFETAVRRINAAVAEQQQRAA